MSKRPQDTPATYQAPRALRLGGARAGKGDCNRSGSDDQAVCYQSGFGALGQGCSYSGHNASGGGCTYSGFDAVGDACYQDGSGATGLCTDSGSSVVS
jgi:hypothetical protein